MPQVFISHSSTDQPYVEREIVELLERHGIATWYSRDSIHGAEEWESRIRVGLTQCDWFLVVLTPDAVKSEWVKTEVHWALEHRRGKVVPLLCEDCDIAACHLMLPRVQFVDFRRINKESRRRLLAVWDVELQDEGLDDVESTVPISHRVRHFIDGVRDQVSSRRTGVTLFLVALTVILLVWTFRPKEQERAVDVYLEQGGKPLSERFDLVVRLEGGGPRTVSGQGGHAVIRLPINSVEISVDVECNDFIVADEASRARIENNTMRIDMLADPMPPPLDAEDLPDVSSRLPTKDEISVEPAVAPEKVSFTYTNETGRNLRLLLYRCYHHYYEPEPGRAHWTDVPFVVRQPQRIEEFTRPYGWFIIYVKGNRDAKPQFLGVYDLYSGSHPSIWVRREKTGPATYQYSAIFKVES